ncbi:uncharacterized protein LOC110016961 isoform X3 [Oryzias latipes]
MFPVPPHLQDHNYCRRPQQKRRWQQQDSSSGSRDEPPDRRPRLTAAAAQPDGPPPVFQAPPRPSDSVPWDIQALLNGRRNTTFTVFPFEQQKHKPVSRNLIFFRMKTNRVMPHQSEPGCQSWSEAPAEQSRAAGV